MSRQYKCLYSCIFYNIPITSLIKINHEEINLETVPPGLLLHTSDGRKPGKCHPQAAAVSPPSSGAGKDRDQAELCQAAGGAPRLARGW